MSESFRTKRVWEGTGLGRLRREGVCSGEAREARVRTAMEPLGCAGERGGREGAEMVKSMSASINRAHDLNPRELSLCGGLSKKCPSQALVFKHLVPH